MCIFCQIVNKEIPAEIMFEDDKIIAFKDTQPSAPIHLLIIPKKHIQSLAHIEIADQDILGEMIYQATILAKKHGIAESGYKTVINTGKDGGQIIGHLHLHLLGGAPIHNQV